MDHNDHLALILAAVEPGDTAWTEFGSGTGAFTLALADALPETATIISVDRDRGALKTQKWSFEAHLNGRRGPSLQQIHADYTRPLELPPLDGVLMANSLHYQRDKEDVLRLVQGYLRPGGRFVLVEYNTDRGNHWVPHPLSYASWERLARRTGFRDVRMLGTRPSRFLGGFYSSLARVDA